MVIDEGTSCATATRPTSRITVANSISRRLKPSSPLRRVVNSRCILDLEYGLAHWPPVPSAGSCPNLRDSGRKQNDGPVAEIRIAGVSEVYHGDGRLWVPSQGDSA